MLLPVAATPPDTRTRILDAALEEFAARGYHATSIREIAERVGVTKTAVLYHFPGKAEIVGALAAPMLDDLDAALAAAAIPADPVAARWAVIEGLVEVWLAHRYLLRMNLYDLALAVENTVFHRFRDALVRANALVAGPDPSFERQVRAAQAIAMLSDPIILFADAPVEALRAAVLQGVRTLLDAAPAPAPSASSGAARGRRGRPGAMSPAMAETARRMHAAGSPAAEIAAALGVSRATVYRHLPESGK
jgi:AcrR family transcriptional regulator